MDHKKIIESIIRRLGEGDVSGEFALPAIRALARKTGKDHISNVQLLEMLSEEQDSEILRLVQHMRLNYREQLLKLHELCKSGQQLTPEETSPFQDLPLSAQTGWITSSSVIELVGNVIVSAEDADFAETSPDVPESIQEDLNKVSGQGLAAIGSLPDSWFGILEIIVHFLDRLGDLLPKGAPAEAVKTACDAATRYIEVQKTQATSHLAGSNRELPRHVPFSAFLPELRRCFEEEKDPDRRRHWFDLIYSAPTDAGCDLMNDVVYEKWAQERAILILTLRFGHEQFSAWPHWAQWLKFSREMIEKDRLKLQSLVEANALRLLALWYKQQENADQEVCAELDSFLANTTASSSAAFMSRHRRRIELYRASIAVPPPLPKDRGVPEPSAPPKKTVQPASEQKAESVPKTEPKPAPIKPKPAPAKPKTPSLWQEHVRPFVAENWYMVAGIMMVIVGSSLLAYFTWDKHWIIPYTILPVLLGSFTAGLAGVGNWVHRRGKEFHDMGAMLRATAIGLLPVNFMALAVLANDDRVATEHKIYLTPLMAMLYLTLGGWGLHRWCRAVHERIGMLLGGTLLLLNSLVIVGPLSKLFGSGNDQLLRFILGSGFYLGFFVVVLATRKFADRIMTRELAEQRRVPWFFGSVLIITFLQVFAWVHAFIQQLPHVYTYAPMIVLSGWLVLRLELRGLQLRGEQKTHGGESFLGFALIMLGVLMGAGHEYMRIVCLLLSAVAWYIQAIKREHALHYWIGLTLAVLAGSSVALLPGFPGQWMPLIGLGMAAVISAIIFIHDRSGNRPAREAAVGMQVAVLMLTAVVAVLSQWHFRSPPMATAGCLAIIVAGFFWRGFREKRLAWIHTAAVIAGIALPYIGCVDLENRSLHGNTMVFGLAILSAAWLLLNGLVKHLLIRNARSTVLVLYGSVAVVAMILRVTVENITPGDSIWWFKAMDYFGPLLIAATLTFATYYTRSLIPSVMSITIVVILFPELRAQFREAFQALGWGSGFGSACSAVGIVIGSIILRRLPSLRELPGGDLFMGRVPFPLRRADYTLFTWPLIASALFLMIKTETLTLGRNLSGGLGNMPIKTAIAIGLTGVAWILTGCYHHRHRLSPVTTYLGCFWIFAGICLGYFSRAADPFWAEPVLITILLFLTTYLGTLFGLRKRLPWVDHMLLRPFERILRCSAAAAALGVLFSLLAGFPVEKLAYLSTLVIGLQIWQGIKTRQFPEGGMLFFFIGTLVLAISSPGGILLLERLSWKTHLSPILVYLLSIQCVQIVLEYRHRWRVYVEPLLTPLFLLCSLAALLFGLAVATQCVSQNMAMWEFSTLQKVLLLLLVLITARSQDCRLSLLVCVVLAYEFIAFETCGDTALVDPTSRLKLLLTPWRWASLSMAMVIVGRGWEFLRARAGKLAAGAFPQKLFYFPHVECLYIPAVLCATGATFYHTVNPAFRASLAQLPASYTAAAAMCLLALCWRKKLWNAPLYILSTVLLVIGNVHAVRLFGGDYLRGVERGLSNVHLVSLAFAATLLQLTAIRYALRREPVTIFVNRVSLILAGCVLALLSINYFTNPDLQSVTSFRFCFSGALALLAGWYFRRAARKPGPGETELAVICEGFYHFGITMFIWCMALLVPWFRTPVMSLFALGLPVIYFYLNTEFGHSPEVSRRYRHSTALLCFVILGLYTFRLFFHMVLFPETPMYTNYYHFNAPLVIVLSFIMLRLHGLGGNFWLAFYGGMGMIIGSYFTLTWFPRLSPFTQPIASAWAAIFLAHLWTVGSHERSPLRTFFQRMADLNDDLWVELRRWWGVWVLILVHVGTGWGLIHYESNPKMVALLLCGVASVGVYHGILRRLPIFFVIAGIELLLALHADFVVPSYLDRSHIIWVIAGLWGGVLIIEEILQSRGGLRDIRMVSASLAFGIFAHILYHHPDSPVGLWAMALIGVLGLLTPARERSTSSESGNLAAMVLLAIPAWLMFFGQMPFAEMQRNPLLACRPLLLTIVVLFLTGSLARFWQARLGEMYTENAHFRPRMFDVVFAVFRRWGNVINSVCLWLSMIVTVVIQTSLYDVSFTPAVLTLICLLYAAFAVAWYYEGLLRRTMLPYIMIQACALGIFTLIRRHLILEYPGVWHLEYDVWASLAVSFILTALRQHLSTRSRAMRIPLLGTMLCLPVLTMIWCLVNNMGSNVSLMIVGLHSLMFTYMGKDDRQSPYNIVAIGGFVTFILMLFWTKMHFEVIHAYVIPVGLGILVLLQLFRERIEPATRNAVRLVTLLAMLGSAGFYALAGKEHTVVFVLTFGLLAILAMGLGSFLRIKLYVLLGFAGLIVDMGAIVQKVVVQMDRSGRMTVIGSLVLLVGLILVSGAIYYKTHHDRIQKKLAEWRHKLGEWE